MLNAKYNIRNIKGKRSFSLAELLLALAIASILLVAVSVAFNASVINYRENEDAFRTINNARQALCRITTQLRTASAVDPNSPNSECTLITGSGEDITYRYNSTDNKLYLITNDDHTDSDYVLCDNVTSMTFQNSIETEDSETYVKSVQISMTVSSGDVQQVASAAAVIRKNLH